MILELLRSGQNVCFRARGRSMWPAIPSGSRIEVRPCAASDLRVGQIAAFERHQRVVVHRVKQIGAQGVHFAGDSLQHEDGCIEFDRILGRARVLERRALNWRLPRRTEMPGLWRGLRRLATHAGLRVLRAIRS